MDSSNAEDAIQEAAHDSLWALSQALGGRARRKPDLPACSEVGRQFRVGRHYLRSEDLLKSERSREDSDKCLLLTRKTSEIRHKGQGRY